jgi:hypothetical protein
MTKADDYFNAPGELPPYGPWTESELRNIASKVSCPPDEPWFNRLINAAHAVIIRQLLHDDTSKKPHAAKEIGKLKQAVDVLREAMKHTGAEARSHLEKHMRPSPHGPDFTIGELGKSLWAFEFANRNGFKELPLVRSDGRRSKKHITEFFNTLKRLHEDGNEGGRVTPFKSFRDACANPLIKYGICLPGEGGRDDITSLRKRRTTKVQPE